MTRIFDYDTETNLVLPGLAIPEIICAQWGYDGAAPQIRSHVEDWRSVLHEALFDPETLIRAHNGAFDLAVVAEAEPDFVQPVFRMLANKRGRDTMIAETLIAIKDGNLDIRSKKKGEFSLGGLAKKYLGHEMSKGQDSWRLRYATLKGLPAAAYPEEAKQYCYEDVTCLRDVAAEQTYASPDEWMQVAAAFALHLAQAWGVRTDGPRLLKLEAEIRADMVTCERILTEGGFFSDGTVKKAKVQEAVIKACEAMGREPPKTNPTALQLEKWKAGKLKEEPTGSVKTDADTIESIKDYEPNLKRLSQLTTARGDIGKYIEPMKGGIDKPMNSRPNVLVATGRTSWAGGKNRLQNPWAPLEDPPEVVVGTNLANFPRREGMRDCIVPRPGHWWLSVDYDSLELRTLAQGLLWIVGHSVLASRYAADANYDPHTDFASQLMGVTYAEAMALKKAGDKKLKAMRQMSKAANFGFPGGLGLKKFVDFARKSYGVTLSFEEAGILKERWFSAFPEMRGFFEYINHVASSGAPLRQFVSRRLRGNVGFCDGANSTFQGLASDGAKRAFYATSMACYAEPSSPLFGTRPLISIYDEICAETPIATAHEAAFEMVRIMEVEMQAVTPDVPIRASPALSTCWLKAAEAKYGADGRLTAWDL